jgi:predicted hydrocarbon binding protein/KaiC/GvpD/RAD55 family RecA-like ATPase
MSLHWLQEVPNAKIVMLVGPPGSGKSTFCYQAVLYNLAVNRPVIFVTTEYGTLEAERFLKMKGLTKIPSGLLNYVDAYNQTVGLPVVDRPDTISVSSANLTNIGIAITKHQKNIGKKDILLVFDSLTSPYLLCGPNVVRFFRLFLSRLAGDGNSVFVCFDEGSGREEDVVGMMSIANGIVKIRVEEDHRVFYVVKHPRMNPTKIETPLATGVPDKTLPIDRDYLKQNVQLNFDHHNSLRKEIGDYVNIAWRNLILWSGMLWDPKRFPKILYDWIKFHYNLKNWDIDLVSFFPWKRRLAFKLFAPRSFSKVVDVKKAMKVISENIESVFKVGKMEYLEKVSRTDEHYIRIYENYECWGFENIGAPLAVVRPAMLAAMFNNLVREEINFNVVHTKCIGLGDPYCEHKMVPGEIGELTASLEKDSSIVEGINDRLMDYIIGFLVHGKTLMKRPTLGSLIHIHELQRLTLAPTSQQKLQLIFRMGGARAGKILGERLIGSGFGEKESINRVIKLIDYCKAGKITLNETLRIRENCETFGFKTKEPSCHFTTGFLNGFFYAVKNQHVRETKCIATGDPYCEWEFR